MVPKKGNPHLAAILKYFLEVINLSVYIFGQFRLVYASGEEIVEKDARMSLIRLFEHMVKYHLVHGYGIWQIVTNIRLSHCLREAGLHNIPLMYLLTSPT